MSHNRFLSFDNSTSSKSSSTFIIGSTSKVQSIDIKITDEIIILPDPNTVDFDAIQYRKLIHTPRDVIFSYNGLQKGKMYFHMQQTIIFHKFKSTSGVSNWIS
jgi:hypothetical protein